MDFKPDKVVIYKFLEPSTYTILLTVILFIPASFLYPIPTRAGLPQFIAELLAPYYSACIKCSPHVSSSALNLISSYISASILEFVNSEYNIIDYEDLRNSLAPPESHMRIAIQILMAMFLGIAVPFLGLPLSYYEPGYVTIDRNEPPSINWLFLALNIVFWYIVIGITYLKIIKRAK